VAAVNLGVPLLPAMPSHLKYCHALDANFLQRALDRIQLGVLNDRFDLSHDLFEIQFTLPPLGFYADASQ
jgi:hypothetical protein